MGLVKSWLFWEWLYHTASNLFCSSFNTPIFSPISTSMSAFVLTGGWYLLIIAQLILRYCSREGNDAFWMVLAKTLNCFSRAFTTSTIHRIFVMCLDSLASDDHLRKEVKSHSTPSLPWHWLSRESVDRLRRCHPMNMNDQDNICWMKRSLF